jgi:hypothetical protein
LSHSFPFDDYRAEKESGAIVEIEDNEGNKFPCHEKKKGLYESSPEDFTGKTGKSYRLHITTSNGQHYMSDGLLCAPHLKIDSVYFEYKEVELQTDYTRLQGIQFYINTHDPLNKTFLLPLEKHRNLGISRSHIPRFVKPMMMFAGEMIRVGIFLLLVQTHWFIEQYFLHRQPIVFIE